VTLDDELRALDRLDEIKRMPRTFEAQAAVFRAQLITGQLSLADLPADFRRHLAPTAHTPAEPGV